MPKILYHYCSTEKFRSIVESRSIRLSDLRLSNDSQEGQLALAAFRRAVDKGGLDEMLTDFLKRRVERRDAAWQGGDYGFCLSEHGDQLSQWRGYADDGYGIAIGFDADVLERLGPALTRVAYSEAGQEAPFHDFVAYLRPHVTPELLDLLRRPDEEIDVAAAPMEQGEDVTGWQRVKNVVNEFPLYRYYMKGTAFSEEAEWRLIEGYGSRLVPEGFFSLRDRLVPYRSHALPANAISRVLLGPKNTTPEYVVEDLTGPFFGAVPIVRAKASYR